MPIKVVTSRPTVTRRFIEAIYEVMDRDEDIDHLDIADSLQCTVLDLVQMESGLQMVKKRQISLAVKKLGVSVVWLTTGEGQKVIDVGQRARVA